MRLVGSRPEGLDRRRSVRRGPSSRSFCPPVVQVLQRELQAERHTRAVGTHGVDAFVDAAHVATHRVIPLPSVPRADLRVEPPCPDCAKAHAWQF